MAHLKHELLVLVAIVGGIAIQSPGANAQCDPGWLPSDASPFVRGDVYSSTFWDPDGGGPLHSQMIIGGAFSDVGENTIRYVARWDGARWHSLGTGLLGGTVNGLTTWDPDGAGPLSEQLVVAGSFHVAGDAAIENIARWDGEQWHGFGSGLNSDVECAFAWDPDGDGPEPSTLYVGGFFTFGPPLAGGRIARWDGAQWQPMGAGFSGVVKALAAGDTDGDGPLPEQLIAAGSFSRSGPATVLGVARWDGNQWHPFGSGVGDAPHNTIESIVFWDPDGIGPLMAQLVVAGNFTIAGSVTANAIACWDGSQWHAFGDGMSFDEAISASRVHSLLSWDPDGDDPVPPVLVAGGNFEGAGGIPAERIAYWDGTAWHSFGDEAEVVTDTVFSLIEGDIDGEGPYPSTLIVGAEYSQIGDGEMNALARWTDLGWRPFGRSLDDEIRALKAWDADGSGPALPRLFASGWFTSYDREPLHGDAWWDIDRWRPVEGDIQGNLNVMVPWDPDGAGPLSESLFAGTFQQLRRWDGFEWHHYGAETSGPIYALYVWDPDGSGPNLGELIAGGPFVEAGGQVVNQIARWDGSQWHPFSSGFSGGTVLGIAAWDADGSGPIPSQLIAGGEFLTAGSRVVNRIARWSGTEWQSYERQVPQIIGMNNAVRGLTVWDPDGAGAQAEQVLAYGLFTQAVGVGANRLARWNGVQWVGFGSGFNGTVNAILLLEPEIEGQPAPLVAAGYFTTAGGTSASGMARWNGNGWIEIDGGVPGGANAVTVWDPDGLGPLSKQICVGGPFHGAGQTASSYFARYALGTISLVITSHPVPASVCSTGTVRYTVSFDSSLDVGLQWQHEAVPSSGLWVNLNDGESPGLGIVSGSGSSGLEIQSVSSSAAGAFRCVVSNDCDERTSDAATLHVCDHTADATCDGNVDLTDLATLLTHFGTTQGATRQQGDFNGDGAVDLADLALLLTEFGATCP